jgi:hypothetical protein
MLRGKRADRCRFPFSFFIFIQACPPMPLKPIKLNEQSESVYNNPKNIRTGQNNQKIQFNLLWKSTQSIPFI